MKKTTLRQVAFKLACVAIALFAPLGLRAQTTVTIGDGTATSNTNPIGTYYNYSITEQLYTADEIGMAGTISSISFYYMGNAAKDLPITVYMKHVDEANLASGGITLADADEVFTGTLSVTTTAGWVTIELDSPFAYDGTSSLLIGCIKDYLYYFSGQTWQGTATTSTMACYNQNDYDAYTTSTTPSTAQANRPNIQLEITPSSGSVCERPETMEASDVTSTSATLTWSGGSGTYNVEVKGGSYTDWTAVLSNTTLTTTTLTLQPITSYQARVQSVCDGTTPTSGWKTASFTTPCGAEPLNYVYGFEEEAPFSCWTAISGTVSRQSGTTHTGSYRLDFRGTTSNMIAFPPIDAATNTLRVEFWTRPESTGGSSGKFAIGYMTDITDASTFVAVETYNSTEMTTSYVMKTVDLVDAPVNARIAFRQFDCSTNYYWYVDDVTVKEIPSCYKPTEAHANVADANNATIVWTPNPLNTAGGSYSILDAEYNPVAENLTGTSFALSDLEASHDYTYYVQTNCFNSEEDEYVELVEVSFSTPADCAAPELAADAFTHVSAHQATVSWTGFTSNNAYVVSYRIPAYIDGTSEDFNGSSVPTGWTKTAGVLNTDGTATLSGTSSWSMGTSNNVFDKHIYMNMYSHKNYWLITPEMTLNEGAALSFDIAYTAYSTDDQLHTGCTTHRFAVLISTDNMATWTILREWNNSGSTYVLDEVSQTGETVNDIDISSYAGQTVYIAFFGYSQTSSYDNNFHLDNVTIGTPIPATAWQTVTPNPTATTTTITDLSAETTYEVMVKGLCNGGAESEESDIQSFTTTIACPAPTTLAVEANADDATTSVDLTWVMNGAETDWQLFISGDERSPIDINEGEVAITDDNVAYTLTDLTPGTDYTFKVRANCETSYDGDATSEWSNTVSFTTEATCLEPTDFAVVEESVEPHQAEFSWTAGGDEELWDIYYSTIATEAPVNGETEPTVEFIEENPYTLTGTEDAPIDAATTYYVWVRAHCGDGEGEQSPWVGPVSFTTPCEATTALGYTENFDDYTAGNNVLPVCWSYINTTTNSTYAVYPRIYPNSSWSTYANSAPNCLYFYSYYSSYSSYDPQPQYAILPEMDGLAGLQVTLMARGNNATSTFKIGTMSDPTDASTFEMITEQELTTSYPEEPYEYIIPADCQNSYLAIMIDAATSSRASNGVYIDDIVIREAPTCFKPTGLAVTENSTTNNGATITWTAGGEETEWQIEYATDADFTDPSYQTVSDDPTYTFNGLSDATTYYVHVQAVCGGSNGSSEYSATVNFTTLQSSVSVPYTNDFESENGWLLVNGNLTNVWTYGEATSNGEGSHALYISNDGGTSNAYSNGSHTMVYATKLFDFEAGVYTFSYDWKANGESGWDFLRVALVPSSVQLTAGTSLPSGLTSTAVPSGWIALDGGSQRQGQSDWQSFASNEMEVAAGTYMMVFAWRNDGGGGSNPPAAIDNVSIQKITCTTPASLAALASGITATTAQLTWTETGESTAWQIELTEINNSTSFIIDVEEADLVEGVYTVTDLTSETQYGVRVRANCGEESYSNWSAQISFETAEDCQMADGLAAVATNNSAVISWNGYGQTSFNLRYSTDGENWETQSNVANPYTIDELAAATTYYVEVQPTCADAESWSDQLVFTTECDAIIITESWEEGFEDGALSSCWKQDGNGTWSVGTGDYSTSTGAHSGNYNAKINHNTSGDATKLITPVLDITALDNPTITFWYINRKWSSDIDGFAVYYRTAANAEWTLLDNTSENHESWTKATYLLPEKSATYQIAFEMTDGYGYGVGIDDIVIKEFSVDFSVEANKWYAISSPVHNSGNNETLEGVTNLTSGAAYDLYGYTEGTGSWNKPSTVLEQGKGYIYRRADNATLSFVGIANSGEVSVDLSYQCADNTLKGFNLVGNPYPNEYTIDDICYSLTTDGIWTAHNEPYTLDVAEAVLIQTAEDDVFEFTEEDGSKAGHSSSDALAFTVSNGEYEDVAYAMFENGESLRKIGHLNNEAPMLSIPVEGSRYAIADLGNDCESFDMVLRGQAGTYTLNFSGYTGYCHLIDRVAGKDIDLLATPAYTFSSTGFDSDRFTVKLTPDAVENVNGNFAYWDGNAWVVEGNGTLQVFDVVGRQVSSIEVNSQFSILNSQFPGTGVYVLRMGGKSQKIVVK